MFILASMSSAFHISRIYLRTYAPYAIVPNAEVSHFSDFVEKKKNWIYIQMSHTQHTHTLDCQNVGQLTRLHIHKLYPFVL